MRSVHTDLHHRSLTEDQRGYAAKAFGGVDGLSALLSKPGTSIEPAKCTGLLKHGLSLASTGGSDPSAAEAMLTYGTTTVLASTTKDTALLSSKFDDAQARTDQLLKDCGEMKLTMTPSTGSPSSATLKISKANISTDAEKAIAVTEEVSVGSSTVTITVVSAVQGNLALTGIKGDLPASMASRPAAGAPGLDEAMNAALAAAK